MAIQALKPGKAEAAASFFARSGVARLARHWRPSDACVLTFHGLRDGGDDARLLDLDQHLTVELFAEACEHLARHYTVLPLGEVVAARRAGRALPHRTVAITFDDGYASNYLLGYPVLKALSLPATIFATTGFVDGRVRPWFHRLELALMGTRAGQLDMEFNGERLCLPLASREDRMAVLRQVTPHLKSLPNSEMLELLAQIERALDLANDALPPALKPMTWDMAREMEASGLIEIGGHTDTHPILARCTEAEQAEEIRMSQLRLTAELGRQATLFAYTNGGPTDFTATTQRLLSEHGFDTAFTMMPGFLLAGDDWLALPRYGNPTSCDYLEAVVSGSMARFRSLRENLGLVRAA